MFAVGRLGPIVSTLFSPTSSGFVLAAAGFSVIRQIASLALQFLRTPPSPEACPVTALQFASLLVVPVGGLVIGGVVLWLNREGEVKDAAKPDTGRR